MYVLHEREVPGSLIMGWGKSSSQGGPRMSGSGAALQARADTNPAAAGGHWDLARALPNFHCCGQAQTTSSCPSPFCTASLSPLAVSHPRGLHPTGMAPGVSPAPSFFTQGWPQSCSRSIKLQVETVLEGQATVVRHHGCARDCPTDPPSGVPWVHEAQEC